MFNKEAARMVAEASRASIEKIAELSSRYGIECRFERVPGYLYTEKRRYVAPLKNEAIAASESGVAARWVAEVPLPFQTRGGVLFENQAQFHPREYLLGLAQQVPGDGSFVFD
jgi:glycine/D-amino acid oxidase-like deaminating enzyme